MEWAVVAEAAGVWILLEVDLEPARAAELLARVPSERVGINYDTGNSAYWGFDPRDEIPRYGERIMNVHLKDCTRKDYSVPFGTGEVNFDLSFQLLKAAGYRGDFVLQAARGQDDCGVARTYAEFSRPYIARLQS